MTKVQLDTTTEGVGESLQYCWRAIYAGDEETARGWAMILTRVVRILRSRGYGIQLTRFGLEITTQ